jgi:hypothetical protein
MAEGQGGLESQEIAEIKKTDEVPRVENSVDNVQAKETRVEQLKSEIARLRFDVPLGKIPEIRTDPATGEDLSSNEERMLWIQRDVMLRRAEAAMENELGYGVSSLPNERYGEDGEITSESLQARLDVFRKEVGSRVDKARMNGEMIFNFEPHTGEKIPQDSLKILRQLMKQEGSSAKIRRSLQMDIYNHEDGKTLLEDSPHIIERFDQSRVEDAVNRISEFYNTSQQARKNGLKSEIYVAKEDSFTMMEEEQIKDSYKEIVDSLKTEEEKTKLEQDIKTNAECVEGINEKLSNGNIMIILKESAAGDDSNITHELLHSMSKEAGLVTVDTKETKARLKNDLNEAVTEILAQHFVHPELDLEQLAYKVPAKEVSSVGYRKYVSQLLVSMYATEVDGVNPFTFNDLKKYYFGEVKVENHFDLARTMVADIASRIPKEFLEDSLSRLIKLL